jgi:hypothetical protein
MQCPLLSSYEKGIKNPVSGTDAALLGLNYVGGLGQAYWDFARNLAIEQNALLTPFPQTPCTYQDDRVANDVVVPLDYLLKTPLEYADVPVDALYAKVYRVKVPKAIKGKVKIVVEKIGASSSGAAGELPFKVYPKLENTFDCAKPESPINGYLIQDLTKEGEIVLMVGNTGTQGFKRAKIGFYMGQLDWPQPASTLPDLMPSSSPTLTFPVKNKGKAPLDYKVVVVRYQGTGGSVAVQGEASGEVAEVSDTAPGPQNTVTLKGDCLGATADSVWKVQVKDPGAEGEPIMGATEVTLKCSGSGTGGSGGGGWGSGGGGAVTGGSGGTRTGASCPATLFVSATGDVCESTTTYGDPHLKTFDGLDYSFQGVGEFVYSRSSVPGMPFEVHTRYRALGLLGSLTSGVAVRVGSDRVTVLSRSSTVLEVKVNGQIVEVPYSTGSRQLDLADGGRMRVYQHSAQISWKDGSSLGVQNLETLGGHLILNLTAHPRHKALLSGLAGNYNNNRTDEFQLRSGTLLPNPPSFEQLYRQYGLDWRVSQGESLFDYAVGESTATFSDYSFPTSNPVISASERARAEQLCQAAGVVTPSILESCIFDVVVTGEDNMAEAAALSDPDADIITITPFKQNLSPSSSTVLSAVLPPAKQGREVLWSASAGTLERLTSDRVRYTAPSTVGSYTVTAQATGANARKSANLHVQTLSVSPNAIETDTRTNVGLTATVNNPQAGDQVVWTAARGQISTDSVGLYVNYTPPLEPGEDTLTATLVGTSSAVTLPVQVYRSFKYSMRINSTAGDWGQTPQFELNVWLPNTAPFHVSLSNPGAMGGCPFANHERNIYYGGQQAVYIRRSVGQGVYQFAVQNVGSVPQNLSAVLFDNDVRFGNLGQFAPPAPLEPGQWWMIGNLNTETRVFTPINTVTSNFTPPYPDTPSACP